MGAWKQFGIVFLTCTASVIMDIQLLPHQSYFAFLLQKYDVNYENKEKSNFIAYLRLKGGVWFSFSVPPSSYEVINLISVDFIVMYRTFSQTFFHHTGVNCWRVSQFLILCTVCQATIQSPTSTKIINMIPKVMVDRVAWYSNKSIILGGHYSYRSGEL